MSDTRVARVWRGLIEYQIKSKWKEAAGDPPTLVLKPFKLDPDFQGHAHIRFR